MQSIKAMGVCAVVGAVCCAATAYGDVAIQDLTPVSDVTPVSDAPPSSAMLPVLFVQADASMMKAAAVRGKTLTVGQCVVYSSSIAPDDTPYGSGPVGEAAIALNRVFGRKMVDLDKPVNAEVTVVAQPKQGKLTLEKFPNGGTTFNYRSEIGYLGKETFTLLVKIEGHPPIKIIYFFTIVKGGPDDAQINQYCGTAKIKFWKISHSPSDPTNLSANDLAAWKRVGSQATTGA
jgi:hypothetical protein